jgi:prolyl-tRNA editing enzyme YbaK/EbsC (Cys-tRNA(Pro) deacylase)
MEKREEKAAISFELQECGRQPHDDTQPCGREGVEHYKKNEDQSTRTIMLRTKKEIRKKRKSYAFLNNSEKQSDIQNCMAEAL